jgi:hypothetical protein
MEREPLVTLDALSTYCSLSVCQLRRYIHDRRCPLPHSRVGRRGKILVRISDFDAWLEARHEGTKSAEQLLADRAMHLALEALQRSKPPH